MKSTTLLVGALVAGGLTVLGLGLRNFGAPAAAADEAGQRVFPDLFDGVNDVASVEITSAGESFRIERDDRAWGLSTKGGYPVDRSQISKLILGLAELETIEAKTSDPARYERLGLEDPDAEGSESKCITLRDADGETVASLIAGDVRSSTGFASLYVRRNGETQTWLAKGSVEVPTDAGALLDKKILEVERDEVQAAETIHSDGEAVLISKDERADTSFLVRDVPEGRELRFESVGNGMGSALEYLNLEDVMPASEFEPPDQEPVRTSYWTWDDLRIDVAVHEKDEKIYATLRASLDENGPPVERMSTPEDPPEEDPGDDAEDEATASKQTPEQVRARAQELNERLEPWVFEIAAYAKNNFSKRMEDMVKPVEEAEPPVDGAGPPGEEGTAPEDQEPSDPNAPADAPRIEDLLEDPEQVPPTEQGPPTEESPPIEKGEDEAIDDPPTSTPPGDPATGGAGDGDGR